MRTLLFPFHFAMILLVSNSVSAATLYVDLNSVSPVAPYTNWATAAVTVQDAVDAAVDGDQVSVTNGIYQTGGRVLYGAMSNRVAVTKPVRIQSVNGPALTVIQGYQVPGTTNGDSAVRCVYLTNGAALIGFTLTNGATRSSGSAFQERAAGGIYCESTSEAVFDCIIIGNTASYLGGGVVNGVLSNCVIANNWASPGGSDGSAGGGGFDSVFDRCTLSNNYASFGGGTLGGVLSRCVVIGNRCRSGGGGVYNSTLHSCLVARNSSASGGGGGAYYYTTMNNCTVVSNSAGASGGGASFLTFMTNCIVYDNVADTDPNYQNTCVLNYCCTAPLPSAGSGNFTNAPRFLNEIGGNFRLQSNSPCLNVGSNATTGTDLDGRPRIFGSAIDIGAYEFENTGLNEFISWLEQLGLATDGSADNADNDGDGLNNWQEWRAGTVPTNSASVLRLLSPSNHVSGMTIRWQSVSNVVYYLQRSADLAPPAFFSLQSNIVGQSGTMSYTDTNGGPQVFYRVGIQ
jgi:hypothetical protein